MKVRTNIKARIVILMIISICLQLIPMDQLNSRVSAQSNRVMGEKPVSAPYADQPFGQGRWPLKTFQSNYSWLLAPERFNQLSSASQRAVRLAVEGKFRNSKFQNRPAINKQTLSYNTNVEQPAGTNVRVNNPSRDPLALTQSESTVAANGNNIVVSFNDAGNDIPRSGYGFSNDGGKTFTHSDIPELPNSFNLGQGVVARGLNGEFYYATLSLIEGVKSIVSVAKSTDNGATFSLPVDASTTVSNNDDFQDKPWITVDTNANSPFKGNVYVSWTDFSFTANSLFIYTAVSTDGGQTFSRPLIVSNDIVNNQTEGEVGIQGSIPAVAPNGDLYVAYYRLDANVNNLPDANTIVIVKSTDGGRTFSDPKTIANGFLAMMPLTGGSIGVRTNSYPSMAIDQKGTVHIVYGAMPVNAQSSIGGTDRSDVFYIRSIDGGNNFSTPIKLNDDVTTTSQSIPSIAVANNGTIGVRWWDRRNDPIFDSLTDVFMTLSTDGGNSFSTNFQITDHNWVFSPEQAFITLGYHGDYDAMTAFGNDFFIGWSDERSGDPDVYFRKIPANYNAKTPDFSVSAANVYNAVIAGNSVDFPLQLLDRNGFTGTINFSATPQVAGINYSFTPAIAQMGQKPVLTINTNSAAKPDTYLITVTGTSGDTVRRTNLRLTVFPDNSRSSVPTNISNTRGETSIFYQDALKVDSNGTIHVCFSDNTDSKFSPSPILIDALKFTSNLFYKQSTDGGKTFSPAVKIPTDEVGVITAMNPMMGLDNQGNIYIAFEGLSISSGSDTERLQTIVPNMVLLSKSIDGGKTFSSPKSVLDFNQIKRCLTANKTMEVDAKGNILIAVSTLLCPFRGPIEFPTKKDTIYIVVSNDQGETFAKPVSVSPKRTSLQFFSKMKIAFDSQGATYLLYPALQGKEGKKKHDLVLNLLVARDGKSFKEINQVFVTKNIETADLSKPVFVDIQPNMTIDKKDNIYISFLLAIPPFGAGEPDKDIFFVKSTDRGRTFSTPVNVSQDGRVTEVEFSNVLVDNDGNINIGWRSKNGLLLATSTDDGKTFGHLIKLAGNIGPFEGTPGLDSLVLVAGKDNNIIAYWNSVVSAQSEVYICTVKPPTKSIQPAKIGSGKRNQH